VHRALSHVRSAWRKEEEQGRYEDFHYRISINNKAKKISAKKLVI
jgi:hypothetical protein